MSIAPWASPLLASLRLGSGHQLSRARPKDARLQAVSSTPPRAKGTATLLCGADGSRKSILWRGAESERLVGEQEEAVHLVRAEQRQAETDILREERNTPKRGWDST
jgi:hypothetical protein